MKEIKALIKLNKISKSCVNYVIYCSNISVLKQLFDFVIKTVVRQQVLHVDLPDFDACLSQQVLPVGLIG